MTNQQINTHDKKGGDVVGPTYLPSHLTNPANTMSLLVFNPE
jgi:hypothetical protein